MHITLLGNLQNLTRLLKRTLEIESPRYLEFNSRNDKDKAFTKKKKRDKEGDHHLYYMATTYATSHPAPLQTLPC